jgi:hypothetical protein
LPSSTQTRPRAERSRALRHGRSGVAAAVATLLLGTGALAQPSSTSPSAASGERAAPEGPGPTSARIVLIGRAAADPELRLLLRELLEREGVAAEIERADRFDPDELFGTERGNVIRVFVVLGDANQARLRFRDPSGERYLLRKVTLSGGLDDVGRELIGQVVESSVVALLRTSEGMSRKEVAEELERDEATDSGRTAEPPRAAASPAKDLPAEPTRSPWEPGFGLCYVATWSGPELGTSHGPGLVAGARLRGSASAGIELGADRRLAQTLSTPALEASVERTTFHAVLEAGLALSPSQRGFVALGAALELSRTRPRSRAPDVAAAGSKSDLSPALRAELRYEIAAGNFLLGFAALLEASLVRTRYELAQQGPPELLAAPALLRPGGVVTLALRP